MKYLPLEIIFFKNKKGIGFNRQLFGSPEQLREEVVTLQIS